MIKYIEISSTYEICSGRGCFAWYDTVSNKFISFSDKETFNSWMDFKNHWDTENGNKEPIKRFECLHPKISTYILEILSEFKNQYEKFKNYRILIGENTNVEYKYISTKGFTCKYIPISCCQMYDIRVKDINFESILLELFVHYYLSDKDRKLYLDIQEQDREKRVYDKATKLKLSELDLSEKMSFYYNGEYFTEIDDLYDFFKDETENDSCFELPKYCYGVKKCIPDWLSIFGYVEDRLSDELSSIDDYEPEVKSIESLEVAQEDFVCENEHIEWQDQDEKTIILLDIPLSDF